LFLRLAACILLGAAPALCQSNPPPPPSDDFRNDTDPTQAVFLSVRQEFYNLQDGNWQNRLILRKDQVFLRDRGHLGGKVGILTRFEIPFATAHSSGVTHAGLGDVYGQFLHVPFLTRRFALAAGSGLVFPTATYRTLGSGKWTVAPLVAPVWFFPQRKGYFFVKFQNFVSFAGPHGRSDINQLLITPTLLYRVTKRWWIVADTESKIDWERDRQTSFVSGFQVGYMFRRGLGVWVKPEVPWGENRQGDWNLKFTLLWFRVD
jgi:hypothetical protein